MRNRFMNSSQGRVPIKDAFIKTLAGVMMENKELLHARRIIPKGNAAAAGITLGDDILEYTKYDYTGKKFKKEGYLRGFIHTYYHTKREYNLHWSVGYVLCALIKGECCEEE